MEVRQGDRLRWRRVVGEPYALDDRRQVPGSGPDVPVVRLAFIGDAPNQDDEKEGNPFVSKSGRLLHHYLKEAGIYSSGCYFTNVIDRNPGGNLKSAAAQEAIKVQTKAV